MTQRLDFVKISVLTVYTVTKKEIKTDKKSSDISFNW